MNPYVKDKWIEALTSGEYKQTCSYLHTKEGFCCLGVLTDLYLKEMGGTWTEDLMVATDCPYYSSYGESAVTPDIVREWAGLDEENPEVLMSTGWTDLAQMNDGGNNFEEIARVIKEQL